MNPDSMWKQLKVHDMPFLLVSVSVLNILRIYNEPSVHISSNIYKTEAFIIYMLCQNKDLTLLVLENIIQGGGRRALLQATNYAKSPNFAKIDYEFKEIYEIEFKYKIWVDRVYNMLSENKWCYRSCFLASSKNEFCSIIHENNILILIYPLKMLN